MNSSTPWKQRENWFAWREPVSTVLEITEICTRLLKTAGPAVLFENPVGTDGKPTGMPCLANLFGTVKRVAMGVTLEGKSRTTGAELRVVGELLAFLRSPEPPRGLREAWDMIPMAKAVMGMRPKMVSNAPCQEVVWTGDQIEPGPLAGADLLAERTRAADHLAFDRH